MFFLQFLIWVTDEIEFETELKGHFKPAGNGSVNDDYNEQYKSVNECSFKFPGTITPEACIEECRKGIAYSSTSEIFKNCSFSDDDITACQYTKKTQEIDCSLYSYSIMHIVDKHGYTGWLRKGIAMLA